MFKNETFIKNSLKKAKIFLQVLVQEPVLSSVIIYQYRNASWLVFGYLPSFISN